MTCQLYLDNNANKIIAYQKPNTGIHNKIHPLKILLPYLIKS